MTKPRFKLNQKVYYSTKDCYGKIKKVLNIDDLDDVCAQGYRYLVQLEGLWPDWSIADDYLALIKPQNALDIIEEFTGEKSQNALGSTEVAINIARPIGR